MFQRPRLSPLLVVKLNTAVNSVVSLLSELFTLLLEDILVLLQKKNERLILKCHSKNLAGTADTKHIFSPIIKLNTVLVRSVATGQSERLSSCTCGWQSFTKFVLYALHCPDNKSFFVLSMSENGAQIYELMAPTVAGLKT